MAYLPEDLPAPDMNPDDAPFWNHCAAKRLMFQCCEDCGFVQHPPTPLCPRCRSSARGWTPAPETGEVFTFTIVHHPSHPSVRPALPYNIIVVDFPELGHVRLVSNLVDGSDVRIGMKVELAWERHGETFLPRFKRASSP